MNTTTRTALANFKQSKGKNILSGIAIILTTVLVFLIITIGLGISKLQISTVNSAYPSWEVMFRDVNQENAEKIAQHADIKKVGQRLDVADVSQDDNSLLLSYYNQAGVDLNRIKLSSGKLPKLENELVLGADALKAFNSNAKIGDTIKLPYQAIEMEGLGFEQTKTFTISGILKSSDQKNTTKQYGGIVSKAFAKSNIPDKDQRYRLMIKLDEVDSLTSPVIKEKGQELGSKFGVKKDDIVENSPYLLANYIDPTVNLGIAIFILIVVLAGSLTTYSIYYVSMIDKVQVYGKLKALGATKRQIRQIVFKEGFMVGAIAIPIGLLIGTISSYFLFNFFLKLANQDNLMINQMLKHAKSTNFSLFQWWIYLGVTVISLLTIWISLVKPTRIASKISPIEAMGFMGETNPKKKNRKGFKEMTLAKLTLANLSFNKKKSLLTIFTLGITGIMFMVMATILNCSSPQEIARYEIRSDYRIEIESWSNDKMHPEREWTAIQQNNPLNSSFKSQVSAIDGVKSVVKNIDLTVNLLDFVEDNKPQQVGIRGLHKEDIKEIKKTLVEGSVNFNDMKKKKGVLIGKYLYKYNPDIKIGSKLKVNILNGNKEEPEEFLVMGIVDSGTGILGTSAMLAPESVLTTLSSHNITSSLDIELDPQKAKTAESALDNLANSNKFFNTYTFQERLKSWESTLALIMRIGYAFMVVIGSVGIMSLINTVINSIYTRKRELGIIQALGMSEKQLIKMLQLEGMVYTVGTILASLSVGNLLGYAAFRWCVNNSILNITTYYYPWKQTLLLIVLIIGIQLVLTTVVSHSFRKETLIDRMRFTE